MDSTATVYVVEMNGKFLRRDARLGWVWRKDITAATRFYRLDTARRAAAFFNDAVVWCS